MTPVVTQDRFRVLFEHAPLGIMRLERDATILEVNQAGVRLGVSSGQSFLNFAGAGSQEKLRELLEDTVDSGHTESVSLESATNDGSTRWVDLYASPLPDTDGTSATVLAIIFDSTQNHLNLDRLRDSDSLLRGVMDFAPVAIAIKDVDGRYIHSNPSAEKAYGFSSVEARGNTPHDFYPPEMVEVLLAHDRNVVESKQAIERQHLVPTPNGDRLISSLKFPLLNNDDEVIAVCSISTDLTDQREFENRLAESEQRFRDFATIVADWFWEMDQDYRFTYQSERFEEITGIAAHQVIGRTSEEAFAGQIDNEEKWGHHFSSMRSRLPYEMEWEIRKPDGGVHILRTIGQPRFDEQGVFQGYRGVGQDVTEARRSERMRERLIAELETKNAELEQFAYTVSHDLKSPLLTIKGFLGLLEHDVEGGNMDTVRGDLERIRTAADRMQILLRDLLELSQVGRIAGPQETVHLPTVVEEVMGILAGVFDDDRIHLRIVEPLPVVLGDGTRLVQVFQNLLENAVKFLGDQPAPVIEVGCRDFDTLATLFVGDNGIGIEPRYHERIFSLFERLDPSGEGTGVGLALTKRIIEHHGGEIWIESSGQPQTGSTFVFTLPAQI